MLALVEKIHLVSFSGYLLSRSSHGHQLESHLIRMTRYGHVIRTSGIYESRIDCIHQHVQVHCPELVEGASVSDPRARKCVFDRYGSGI